MSDYNNSAVIGRLTRDPELSYTSNTNTALCRFSIAVNKDWKTDGEKKEYVNYFDVNVWGKFGEVCNKYLAKGSQVLVQGELKQERYQDKDGKNRSKVTISANNIQFLSKAGNATSNDNKQQHQGEEYADGYGVVDDTEDVPF